MVRRHSPHIFDTESYEKSATPRIADAKSRATYLSNGELIFYYEYLCKKCEAILSLYETFLNNIKDSPAIFQVFSEGDNNLSSVIKTN